MGSGKRGLFGRFRPRPVRHRTKCGTGRPYSRVGSLSRTPGRVGPTTESRPCVVLPRALVRSLEDGRSGTLCLEEGRRDRVRGGDLSEVVHHVLSRHYPSSQLGRGVRVNGRTTTSSHEKFDGGSTKTPGTRNIVSCYCSEAGRWYSLSESRDPGPRRPLPPLRSTVTEGTGGLPSRPVLRRPPPTFPLRHT